MDDRQNVSSSSLSLKQLKVSWQVHSNRNYTECLFLLKFPCFCKVLKGHLENKMPYPDELQNHFRINDIVAVGPESFYVTNWMYFENKILAHLENFLQLQWSSLLFYHNGEVTTVADGFLMANGVNVSPDKR